MKDKRNMETIETAIQCMKEKGVVFDAGLSDQELRSLESRFHFQFLPDLKLFYQAALPVSWKTCTPMSHKRTLCNMSQQTEGGGTQYFAPNRSAAATN